MLAVMSHETVLSCLIIIAQKNDNLHLSIILSLAWRRKIVWQMLVVTHPKSVVSCCFRVMTRHIVIVYRVSGMFKQTNSLNIP